MSISVFVNLFTFFSLKTRDFSYPPRPIGPVVYTFSPITSLGSSIVALVPSASPDERPTYYISTTMNVFMPMSYITTVYKGEGDNSEKIGDFEFVSIPWIPLDKL